jgi:hypothetical protein
MIHYAARGGSACLAASVATAVLLAFGCHSTGVFLGGPLVGYGSCDNAMGYAVVNAGYCPGLTCDTYYITCDGTAWNYCDCDVPSGYILIRGPNIDLGSGPPGCPPSQCDLGNGGDAGVSSEGSVEAGVSESGDDASDEG